MDLEERFENYDEEYLKFNNVKNKLSNRPDLHAFMLLDKLFPGDGDLIDAAEHDEYFLSIEKEDIEKLTDEQILELVRCGVRYDAEFECFQLWA